MHFFLTFITSMVPVMCLDIDPKMFGHAGP